MKKIVGLIVMTISFLCLSYNASAQTARQKQFWDLAAQETTQFSKQIRLDKTQKAYAKRALYNYHAETEVLHHPDEYNKNITKKEIEEHLVKRLEEALSQDQIKKFVNLKNEIVKKNPPQLNKNEDK